MCEGNHSVPSSPAYKLPKSDEEYAAAAVVHRKASGPERSGKFFVYFLLLIVIVSAVGLGFGLVIMPKTPTVKLNSVAVENLSYGNSPVPSFDVTLAAEMSIKNANFGGFRFENITASVLYEGMVVGEAKLRKGGFVKARETERMNMVVNVKSDRLSEAKNLSSDINSGMLKLNTYAQLKGKIRLLRTVLKKKTAVMDCAMNLDLARGSIQDLQCN